MARPQVEIDIELLKELAALGCSKRCISRKIGLSVRSLERRFAAILDDGIAEREIWLHRAQRAAAEKGNAQLLIWLGRQIGQTEAPTAEHATDKPVLKIVEVKPPAPLGMMNGN